MLEIQIFDLAGLLGVIVYLGAYTALQLGFVRGQGYTYASLNMLAAMLVLVSMIGAFHLSSAIIQGSWILISIVGISRFYILSHMARFSDEEKRLLENAFPTLDKVTSRKLLNLGSWRSAEPNEVLTEIGIPIPYLYFLTEGSASVFVNDRQIADISPDTFIGDMTALSGDPATATVMISERSRYFAIPAALLRKTLDRDESLRREVSGSLASAISKKLVKSNASRGE